MKQYRFIDPQNGEILLSQALLLQILAGDSGPLVVDNLTVNEAASIAELTVSGDSDLGSDDTSVSAVTGQQTVTRSTDDDSESATVTVADTRTAAGATGWAAKYSLEANVALGAYANPLYGYLAFGETGKVTGLAAGVCGEAVLSAGCVDGTYAAFEAELGFPSGAATGTNTSFMYLSTYGANKSVFDTNGTLFNLAGVTKGSGKFLQDVTSGPTIRPVQVIKVLTPDGVRYLPLYSTAAIGE